MNLLPDGLVVRLWSRARGLYLYAVADGLGVALRPRTASSPNLAWEARRVRAAHGGAEHVLLRSSATGLFLAASPDPAPRGHRGRGAVQREGDGDASDHWKACWARDGGGNLYLRHINSGGNLRAAGWDRWWHAGVTVVVGKGAAAHWSVEAALPLGPAPPPSRAQVVAVRVLVPRLAAGRVNGARLPVLVPRNEFLGYVAAGCVLGLVGVVEGTGDGIIRAREQDMRAELGCGHLPLHGLTSLAFVAGRGGRGMRSLPLRVLQDGAADNGKGWRGIVEAEASGARGLGDGADERRVIGVLVAETAAGVHAARGNGVVGGVERARLVAAGAGDGARLPGHGGHAAGVHAPRGNGVAGVERVLLHAAGAGGGARLPGHGGHAAAQALAVEAAGQGVLQVTAAAGAANAVADQPVGVANAAAPEPEVAPVGGGAVFVQAGAGPGEAGLPVPVQAGAAAAASPEAVRLEKLFSGMVKNHGKVQEFVRRLNRLEQEARAAGARASRNERVALIRDTIKALDDYKNVKAQADELLGAMEGEDVPVRPAVLNDNPEDLIAHSVRRQLYRRA